MFSKINEDMLRTRYYFGNFLVNNGKVNDLPLYNLLVLQHDIKNTIDCCFIDCLPHTKSWGRRKQRT